MAAQNLTFITNGAAYPVRYTAATHPILNYVEFRTNPEPYMVQGVVQACHAPYVVHGAPGPARTGDLRIRSPTLYPTELRAQLG